MAPILQWGSGTVDIPEELLCDRSELQSIDANLFVLVHVVN